MSAPRAYVPKFTENFDMAMPGTICAKKLEEEAKPAVVKVVEIKEKKTKKHSRFVKKCKTVVKEFAVKFKANMNENSTIPVEKIPCDEESLLALKERIGSKLLSMKCAGVSDETYFELEFEYDEVHNKLAQLVEAKKERAQAYLARQQRA